MDSVFGMIEVENGTGKTREAFGKLQKGSGWMLVYPAIDVCKTGQRLKRECENRRVTIREIQEFLGLAAAQSVYGWFRGEALPSLDNFYALSRYLGLGMEELVVPKESAEEVFRRGRKEDTAQGLRGRMLVYLSLCFEADAPVKQ